MKPRGVSLGYMRGRDRLAAISSRKRSPVAFANHTVRAADGSCVLTQA